MSTGYVLFGVGERTFATELDEVREIVRLQGLQELPGMRPPLRGVIELRGAPLPVLDVRPGDAAGRRADVLVLDVDGEQVGVAVDEVKAVLPPEDLPAGDPAPRVLPAYVVGVRRGPAGPVLLVDVHLLLDSAAEGWRRALEPAVAG